MNHKVVSFAAFALAGLMLSATLPAFAENARFAHHHPRRAEVLQRDRNLRHQLQADKGHLGGHYHQLMAEDRRIHHQERMEARRNGGHLSSREMYKLNREEDHLHRQMKQDTTH